MTLGTSFNSVLEAARTGADWAWTSLYRDVAPVVLGYLRAQGSRDPEDLTGEVFLQVVKALSSFQGEEGEFRSWVFVIAHRKLIDERRYYGRRPVQAAEPATLELQGRSGNAEEEALEQLSTAELKRLMETLSADQRDVLLLRVLGDMKVEDVAKAIGKSASAVQALQKRGLTRLAKSLSASPAPPRSSPESQPET